MNEAKSGRAVAIIVASNCPLDFLKQIQYYATISNIPVHIYPSTNSDLGILCGKPFPVSVLTIRNLVDPELLKMVKG